MPELPEVEIVARSLDLLISGRRVRRSELLRPRLAPDDPPPLFSSRLEGAGILSVGRRGKHLLLQLDNGRTLVTHLRMSGRFMLLGPRHPDPKYAHAVFYLDGSERLVFEDQRHFGLMKIVRTERLSETAGIACLAPEPFSEEFSAEYLTDVLKRSRTSVKGVLLDQTKVCGLGNIYAAEAMYIAGIDPRRRAFRISAARAARLHLAIRGVFENAIAYGSTRPIDPANIGGSIYGNAEGWEWRVYDREGKPCQHCGGIIRRVLQNGRSTYFCGKCQR